MSRRGNGLTADAYVPLADLTPQLADAMLTALRDAGIAAYAAPAPGEGGGYLDVRLPEEPTDRLYADASAKKAAEDILESRLPELREDYAASRNEAEIFAEIVAGFDSEPGDDDTPWPAEENVEDRSDEPALSTRVVKPAADDEDED